MLRHGVVSSCCLRRVAVANYLSPSCSPSLCNETTTLTCTPVGGSNSAAAAAATLRTPLRCRSSSILIANRKRVEMFVGKRYHLPTRLRTAAPDIAVEWDYEQNPMHLYPEIVSIGYTQPVSWQCKVCAHGYKMSVEKRVVRGGGCPRCEEGTRKASMEREAAADGEAEEMPSLLPGEENTALRPKRSTMLNLRTKY